MVHGRGYRVFSPSYCCRCTRRNNDTQKKSTASSANRKISSPCYTAAVPLPELEKELDTRTSKESTIKYTFDKLPVIAYEHESTKDLDENDNKNCPDEIWKQIVNQHDHERMEKEVKKLENRIRNLGKVHSSDSINQTSNKCHNYRKSHIEHRPKCTFL